MPNRNMTHSEESITYRKYQVQEAHIQAMKRYLESGVPEEDLANKVRKSNLKTKLAEVEEKLLKLEEDKSRLKFQRELIQSSLQTQRFLLLVTIHSHSRRLLKVIAPCYLTYWMNYPIRR